MVDFAGSKRGAHNLLGVHVLQRHRLLRALARVEILLVAVYQQLACGEQREVSRGKLGRQSSENGHLQRGVATVLGE